MVLEHRRPAGDKIGKSRSTRQWKQTYMATFMVIGQFDPETDLAQMNTVLAEEVAQVQILKGEGRLGSVHISPARGKVFLEVIAEDAAGAETAVKTLPMAKWWAIDIYPTIGPPAAAE